MMVSASVVEIYRSAPARYPELRGKVAIITGASRAIGAGIAARLAREGMRLVITGLYAAETEKTATDLRGEGVEVISVSGNLSDTSVIDQIFEQAEAVYGGELHLLVNNAADLRRVRVSELDQQLIDDQLTVNIRAPMLCSMRAIALMRPQKEGCIVNITSVGGIRAHLPGLPYGMAKGALDSFTRVLGVDLADAGIRVNAVAPGYIPRIRNEDDAAYVHEASQMIPMRTHGRPEDIGAMVAFLASPDAAYITSQVFYVDGGLSAQLHPPDNPI